MEYVDQQLGKLREQVDAAKERLAAPAPVAEPIVSPIDPEEEIKQAQRTLENAKARVAEAHRLKIAKAEADIAAAKAEEERKLLLHKLNAAEIQRKWEEVQRLKEEAQLAAYRAEKKAEMEREARLNAALEEKRLQEQHEKKLRDLSEQAFQQEQLAKMIEEEAMRASRPAEPEPTPVTITDARHPLSMIFGNAERTPAAESEPVKQQEPVQAPELRPIQNSEMEAVAQHWQNKLRNRTTGNHVTPMLQRFTPEQIFAAIDALAQHPSAVSAERDVQAEFISACLFQGTESLEQRIAEHLKAYAERIAAAKAQREGRQ
jgi:hypothetical protein